MFPSTSNILFFAIIFVLLLYAVALGAWHLLRFILFHKVTGIPDIEHLSNGTKHRLEGSIVIAGGSIAGLLAARLCRDYFERVIIVEPEAWLITEDGRVVHGWTQKNRRSRVMQYHSLQGDAQVLSRDAQVLSRDDLAHILPGCQALLLRGLEKLFPNFHEECKLSEISILPADFKTTFAGAYMRLPWKYFKNVLPTTVLVSRQGIETIIRRLVFAEPSNIEQIAGTVIGIIPDPADKNRVSKVTVRTDAGNLELDAVLLIDCTGLTRAGLKWLERAGYGQIDKHSRERLPLDELRIAYDQKLHYTTQTFMLTADLVEKVPIPGGMKTQGAVFTFLEDQPSKGRRFFVVTKPDGHRLTLFAGQSGEGHQPGSIEEMKEYAKDMKTWNNVGIPDWVSQAMDLLKEVEDTKVESQVRVPGTSYIRYQLAANLPSNFIAIGDSVMTVNPFQGCTKALMGVVALNNILRRETHAKLSSSFSSRFFKEQVTKIRSFWDNSRLLDYGIVQCTPIPGESLSSRKSIRSYVRRLQILALHDDQAGFVILKSAHGIGMPLDAFHPWLVCKILAHMLAYLYLQGEE